MSTYKTNITKRYTIEQFCAKNGTASFKLMKALKKNSEGVNEPICHEGTDIQKCSVIDTAGNTIAWASKAICEDLQNGNFSPAKGLAFLQSEGVNEETGEAVCFFTLSYPGVDASRVIDILAM